MTQVYKRGEAHFHVPSVERFGAGTDYRLYHTQLAALTMHTLLLIMVTSGLVLLQTNQGECHSLMDNL